MWLFLWRGDRRSGLKNPIRRMQCDHKPIIRRMRLDLSNRSGHKLAGRQVTESTLIRQRAMAQQLCEYAQRLIGEILVDEGFLPVLSAALHWNTEWLEPDVLRGLPFCPH